jgi:nucleotide-binding universal stress UspA family protein
MYANPLAYYDVNDNLKELAATLARRGGAPAPRILVGVDGSPASLGAVQHARDRVAGSGGYVRLVNVQPAPGVRDARRQGERALHAAKALLDSAGVSYRADVVFGDPVESLLRQALIDSCSEIALGDSGHSPVLRLLRGSVARRVLKRARMPVTLVRTALRARTVMPPGAWLGRAPA